VSPLLVLARTRDRLRGDEGFTLTELAVTMIVMGIVAAIFTSILYEAQIGVSREKERSDANDQARLAIEEMDREIRSGSLIYDPAAESFTSPTCGGYACVANYSVRVLSQANATTRTPATQCVQWLIQGQQLLRRSWAQEPPTAGTSLAGWRVIATGIVNQSLSPAVPAFALSPGSTRALNITFMVNPRLGGKDAPPTVRLDTTISIRNTATGDPCTPIPTI
jgi:prepilin-type N-terminal cleavage/methylation domain-containing protein